MHILQSKQFSRALTVYLPTLAIAVLCLAVAGAIVEWICQLLRPADLDYAERWLAFIAQQAHPGGDHLGSAYQMPYNASPYPPLSYLIHGWTGQLLGGELLTVRTAGRATTLTMTLLSGVLVFLNSRVLNVKTPYALLAGLLFLASRQAHIFAVSLRPDEMACTLMLLGLYVLLSRRNDWLGGGIFACTLAAKHSFIAVPLVYLVQRLIKREGRSILQFVGSGVGVGVAIMLLSGWMLGPYWWEAFTLQGLHGGNPRQAIFFIGEGFREPVLVIGAASLFLLELTGAIATVAGAFAVSLLLNCVALMKVGAYINYFLEAAALGAILSGYFAMELLEGRAVPVSGFKLKRAAAVFLVALLIPGIVTQTIATSRAIKALTSANPSTALIDRIRSVDAPILTDISGLYFDSGHAPYVTPPDLIMAAVNGGKLDGVPMQQFIEQRGFKAIVLQSNWLERPFYPPSWLNAIQQNYEGSEVIDSMVVLKPKP